MAVDKSVASLQSQLDDAMALIEKLKLASGSSSPGSTATPPSRLSASTPKSALSKASSTGSASSPKLLRSLK